MRNYYLIMLALLLPWLSIGQTLSVNKSPVIAIDGMLDEAAWDISTPLPNLWLGNSDNTAHFGVLWNEDYLYVGIEVTDPDLVVGERQGWLDDGVEICIDGNNNKTNTFDENDRVFIKPIRSFWVQERFLRDGGIQHAYQETATGYTMEFSIAWDSLGVVPAAGKDIGFDIIVNDDDDSVSTDNMPKLLLWKGLSWHYKYPSIWGTLSLSNNTANMPSKYLAILQPNGNDYLIRNQPYEIKWKSYNLSNVNIFVSTNNGSTWQPIATNISASQEKYNWLVSSAASENTLIKIEESGNASLKDISLEDFTVSAPLTPVEPLIKATWQNYADPLDAYYPAGSQGSACGPSSLARIIHTWKFPRQGSGSLDFRDNWNRQWQADFGQTIYNYDNMPNSIAPNSTEEEYKDAATLVYHTAVAMEDRGNSGTDLPNMAYAMENYFNYKAATPVWRTDLSREEWVKTLMEELDNGRIILISGVLLENVDRCGPWHENVCWPGHWFHIDGYNEKGEFHAVLGFGNYQYDKYYDADELSQYAYKNGILTGLEPDLNGKSLELTSQTGNDMISSGSPVDITWNSSDVTNIIIEYTTDNGTNWQTIANNVDAGIGSYNWNVPVINSNYCKVRLTDVSDINVYDQSETVFSILEYKITLNSPDGDEYLLPGDRTFIRWGETLVNEINLEYSTDNGNTWTTIESGLDGSLKSYEWTVPIENSGNCLVRITDISDNNVNDISDANFIIGAPNPVAGPYKYDNNTMLVLHFENDLLNQSDNSEDATALNGSAQYETSPVPGLGKALKLDGSSSSTYLEIPHSAKLSLTEDWTIEMWFKATDFAPGLQYFIQKPGDNDAYFANYAMQLHGYWGNSIFNYYFSGANRHGMGALIPELNKWYHMAFIRDASASNFTTIIRDQNKNVIYDQTNGFPAGAPLTSVQDLLIGQNFNGYIDEVRISDIVRSYDVTKELELTSHNGNVDYQAGKQSTITWNSSNIAYLNLSYSLNGGSSWNTIANNVFAGTGSYVWDIPNVSSDHCKVRLTDASDNSISDKSDGVFSIVAYELSLTQPNGGEALKGGKTTQIKWEETIVPNIKIDYSINNGASWSSIASNVVGSAKSYNWQVPQITENNCLVRIMDISDNSVFDISDATFSIGTPALTLLSPNGGESLNGGTTTTVKWDAAFINNVKIQYSINNGNTWTLISSNITASTGSHQWTVPKINTTQGLIRIADMADNTLFDISDATFTMVAPTIKLLSPNGGETLVGGESTDIAWESSLIDKVKLQYSLNMGSSWNEIASNIPASMGSFQWTIPEVNASYCFVRIMDQSDNAIMDISNAPFTILGPSLTLISPNGSETLEGGVATNVVWEAQMVDKIQIGYSIDNGASWTVIATNIPASMGSFQWTPPEVNALQCLVRVTDVSDNSINDQSDYVFRIESMELNLSSPNGGETLVGGEEINIKWQCVKIDKIHLDFSTDNGKNWEVIDRSITASNESYTWTIPDINSDQCLIRISDPDNSEMVDVSDGAFTIVPGSVGVDFNELSKNLTIYPNPTEGQIQIAIEENLGELVIRLLDGSGRVLSEKLVSSSGEYTVKIDGANGTYILQVTTSDGKEASYKIIKQ